MKKFNRKKTIMMKHLNMLVSTIIGAFFSFFGVLAVPLLLLVPCNVIDYFTGITASKLQGIEIKSKISYQGIVKKITMYVLIFVGFTLDCLIGYVTNTLDINIHLPMLCSAIIASWLVINELISITENCEIIGTPIPFLAPILNMIKSKIEIVNQGDENE